jgi:hypothetical protein
MMIDLSRFGGRGRAGAHAAGQWISIPPFTSMTAPVM